MPPICLLTKEIHMGDMGSTILMLALMGAAFYFLLIRPQQKRAKQQTAMTNALAAGSRVMLSSGVFGTVRHLGERQAIIEIAPGIEMTVIKQAIVKTLQAEDDEFEYSDDNAEPTDLDQPEPNPFDTIEPSDFNDPKTNDTSAQAGEPKSDDPTGQNTQK